MQDDLISHIDLLTVYAQYTTIIRMDVNIVHDMQVFAPICSEGLAPKDYNLRLIRHLE